MSTETLANQLLSEEEGASSKTVYYVQGLAHIGRGVCVDVKVPGAGLPDAILADLDAIKAGRATALAQALSGYALANEVQQAVVISMCYQLGSLSGWPGFRAAFENRDYELAANEMLFVTPGLPMWSPWHKETPKRCEREAQMMRSGVWVPYG